MKINDWQSHTMRPKINHSTFATITKEKVTINEILYFSLLWCFLHLLIVLLEGSKKYDNYKIAWQRDLHINRCSLKLIKRFINSPQMKTSYTFSFKCVLFKLPDRCKRLRALLFKYIYIYVYIYLLHPTPIIWGHVLTPMYASSAPLRC